MLDYTTIDKMKMFLNVHSWRSMRALHISDKRDGEYNLFFKANSIKYSVIEYVNHMMSLHGGKYAGFINAFGTQELEKITERRFEKAYIYSVREDNHHNVLTSFERKSAKLKYGYFDEVYHYFDSEPEITELTEYDLLIAGNQAVKIPRSSLRLRFTPYDKLKSILETL